MAWVCLWVTLLWGQDLGFFPEDRLPNKNTEGTRGNDWTCPKCGNVNFSFRTVCNMRKCNTEKPGSQAVKPGKSSKPEMPEGSWKCEKCNINYPFRTKCNRQNCGADKPSDTKKSPSEPVDDNDQVVQLIKIDCKRAVSLLIQNRELITPFEVVSQLMAAKDDSRYFLHLYLHALFVANPDAGREFHDMQLKKRRNKLLLSPCQNLRKQLRQVA